MKTTNKSGSGTETNDSEKISFDVQELLALARLDLERGSFEPALKKIKELIARPDAPLEGIALAARVYAQLGIWERAKQLFEQYVKSNPQAITEKFQLGMVHFDAGHGEEALKIWEDVLEKQPTYPPALFYRALVLAQQGKAAEARQYLEVLLKSAAVDNLYFGRAKELLQAIDAKQPTNVPARDTKPAKDTVLPPPKGAYKTEH